MVRAEGLLGGKFLLKRQNDGTNDKTKVVGYVAFVKLNLAITEAACLEVITLMQSTQQKAVPG